MRALHVWPTSAPGLALADPFTAIAAGIESAYARLGYWPGHDSADCPEAQTPYDVSRCGCGPKPLDERDAPA